MNDTMSRRYALGGLLAGAVAGLAASRTALADHMGRVLRAASKLMADLGFSFSDTVNNDGDLIVTTEINPLAGVQYNTRITGADPQPCWSQAFIDGLSNARAASDGVALVDLTVYEPAAEASYQVLDGEHQPCWIVESVHVDGIPAFKATHFNEQQQPCWITETVDNNGARQIRSTLLEADATNPCWIVEAGLAGSLPQFRASHFAGRVDPCWIVESLAVNGVPLVRSQQLIAGIEDPCWIVESSEANGLPTFSATHFAEQQDPCWITETAHEVAPGTIRTTVPDATGMAAFVVESNASSGHPVIRAAVAPDADFELRIGNAVYVLVNGMLELKPPDVDPV